jgi:thiopurine S-methyltransferase
MERDFWLERWRENKIGFHRDAVNPHLQSYWGRVAAKPGERVLVPLCGKSEDLRWLADQACSVVGVELSEIAARGFGKEQGIAFSENRQGEFLVFNAERIQIHVGDFLNFTRAVGGGFSLFYDRAALIALPPTMRPAYAERLTSLLDARSRGLLITLEYDTTQMEGPPFSISSDEVQHLLPGFRFERLLAKDCLDEEPRFKERGVQWMREVVYLVTRS